ncbi:MAG: hypothetical protein H6718_10950 [Polyangiaceae bacterium]|nr:hypothetical protein [Myxococcales bacterium]MCB9585906.1 hypothetical protein [Polyangiaceae bacterium]MCB9607164.1 hypothetical protein [Polyangiaceae bacterium]
MVRALNTPTDPELANLSLRLALEWGEDWLVPIQERLSQIRPDLTQAQLDDCQADAKRVFDHALKLGREALKRHGLEGSAAADASRQALLEAFPWLDEANLSRLVSQSLYYALK